MNIKIRLYTIILFNDFKGKKLIQIFLDKQLRSNVHIIKNVFNISPNTKFISFYIQKIFTLFTFIYNNTFSLTFQFLWNFLDFKGNIF